MAGKVFMYMLGGHSPGLLPMFIGQEGFVASFAGELQFLSEGVLVMIPMKGPQPTSNRKSTFTQLF